MEDICKTPIYPLVRHVLKQHELASPMSMSQLTNDDIEYINEDLKQRPYKRKLPKEKVYHKLELGHVKMLKTASKGFQQLYKKRRKLSASQTKSHDNYGQTDDEEEIDEATGDITEEVEQVKKLLNEYLSKRGINTLKNHRVEKIKYQKKNGTVNVVIYCPLCHKGYTIQTFSCKNTTGYNFNNFRRHLQNFHKTAEIPSENHCQKRYENKENTSGTTTPEIPSNTPNDDKENDCNNGNISLTHEETQFHIPSITPNDDKENDCNNGNISPTHEDTDLESCIIYDPDPEYTSRVDQEDPDIWEEQEKFNSNKVYENLKKLNDQGETKRYDRDFKLFGAYAFIHWGRAGYKVMCNNAHFPSVDTVYKIIKDYMDTPLDGVCRFDDVPIFLGKRGLKPEGFQPEVFISEDATALSDKLRVNALINRIVGFSSPLLAETGLPDPKSFPASTLREILEAMDKNSPAKYVNVIMLKSTEDANSPSFCLCAYATDNSCTAENVLQRWTYIKNELEKRNIKVLGFSTDGAPCYLKLMKYVMDLPSTNENILGKWFICSLSPLFHMLQDFVHIGTKLRTRLLNNDAKPLQLGDFTIKSIYLEDLIHNVPKDQHCLEMCDINGSDKMNFKAVTKLIKTKVVNALQLERENRNTPNIGVQYYLKFMRLFINAFLDPNLDPLTRIRDSWFVIFCLRLWRNWLYNHKKFTFENFITLNAYTSMEIDAHSLINITRQFRDEYRTMTQLPKFSSQTCEEFFRRLRSFTGVKCTMVEVCLQGVLNRIKRIDIAEDIECELSGRGYNLGKKYKKNAGVEYLMPNDNDIVQTVQEAKNDAIEFMKGVGIVWSQSTEIPVHISLCNMDTKTKKKPKNSNTPKFRAFLKKYTGNCLEDNDPRYLKLELKAGGYKRMKKSTIVWNLSTTADPKPKHRQPRFQSKVQTKNN